MHLSENDPLLPQSCTMVNMQFRHQYIGLLERLDCTRKRNTMRISEGTAVCCVWFSIQQNIEMYYLSFLGAKGPLFCNSFILLVTINLLFLYINSLSGY